MSSAVDQMSRTAADRPPFTGASRYVAAALLVTGAALQVVEFVGENPADDNAARVAYWSGHLTRVGVSMTAGLVAIPFLLGGVAVVVALTVAASRRFAWAAATLMTLAMVGLAAVHGFELSAYGLVRSGDRAAATAALEGKDLGPPGPALLVMFLGGAVFGVLCLVVAMWRSPRVPRVAPLFLLAFAVFDFAVGFGVVSHSLALVGDAIVAWAVVTGYTRRPRAA